MINNSNIKFKWISNLIVLQCFSIKDQTVPESNGALVSPPVVQELTPVQTVNSSHVSLSKGCTNPTSRTPAGSRLSIDLMPCIKGDSLLKTHPMTGFPLPFFTNNPFVSSGPLEKPQTIDSATTAAGVVGVLVATTTAPSNLSNNPSTDQKSAIKDQVTLAPFGFLPPKIIFSSPTPGSIRNSLIRPTYGPPNLVAPLTPTSNGLLVPIFDAKPPILCRPVFSDLLQKPSSLSRRESSSDKASPAKSDAGSARPCTTVASSGAWFNSPIKQFLDRTRALTSELRSNEADDQPIDLSVRSTQKSSQDTTRNPDSGVCTRVEQDEPLNLSKKHELRAAKTANLVLPSTKFGSSPPTGLGRVVLPKSDLIMPLILSVPSPVNILAQSTTSAISNMQSLSIASAVVTNSASQGRKVPVNNGLLPTPTVRISSSLD